MQRVGRVSRGADNGHVIVSLSEARRNRHARTRTIKKVIEDHEELDVQTFTAKILRDVQTPPSANLGKEAETDFDDR